MTRRGPFQNPGPSNPVCFFSIPGTGNPGLAIIVTKQRLQPKFVFLQRVEKAFNGAKVLFKHFISTIKKNYT